MLESAHFKNCEITCRCGCGFNDVSPVLIELAEKIRHLMGDKPMIVHSVCRCFVHNKNVGGVTNSQHTKGKAMDFHINGVEHEKLFERIKTAFDSGLIPELGGLFLYPWGVHIDVREKSGGRLKTGDYR